MELEGEPTVTRTGGYEFGDEASSTKTTPGAGDGEGSIERQKETQTLTGGFGKPEKAEVELDYAFRDRDEYGITIDDDNTVTLAWSTFDEDTGDSSRTVYRFWIGLDHWDSDPDPVITEDHRETTTAYATTSRNGYETSTTKAEGNQRSLSTASQSSQEHRDGTRYEILYSNESVYRTDTWTYERTDSSSDYDGKHQVYDGRAVGGQFTANSNRKTENGWTKSTYNFSAHWPGPDSGTNLGEDTRNHFTSVASTTAEEASYFDSPDGDGLKRVQEGFHETTTTVTNGGTASVPEYVESVVIMTEDVAETIRNSFQDRSHESTKVRVDYTPAKRDTTTEPTEKWKIKDLVSKVDSVTLRFSEEPTHIYESKGFSFRTRDYTRHEGENNVLVADFDLLTGFYDYESGGPNLPASVFPPFPSEPLYSRSGTEPVVIGPGRTEYYFSRTLDPLNPEPAPKVVTEGPGADKPGTWVAYLGGGLYSAGKFVYDTGANYPHFLGAEIWAAGETVHDSGAAAGRFLGDHASQLWYDPYDEMSRIKNGAVGAATGLYNAGAYVYNNPGEALSGAANGTLNYLDRLTSDPQVSGQLLGGAAEAWATGGLGAVKKVGLEAVTRTISFGSNLGRKLAAKVTKEAVEEIRDVQQIVDFAPTQAAEVVAPKHFIDQMSPEEAERYREYWEGGPKTGLAESSSPYRVRTWLHEDGNIKTVQTYDRHGRPYKQYGVSERNFPQLHKHGFTPQGRFWLRDRDHIPINDLIGHE